MHADKKLFNILIVSILLLFLPSCVKNTNAFLDNLTNTTYNILRGTASYDAPVYINNATGLKLSAPTVSNFPMRQIVIEAIDATSNKVLGSTNSDSSGNFVLSYASEGISTIKLRALAKVVANSLNSTYRSTDAQNTLIELLDNASSAAQWSFTGSNVSVASSKELSALVLKATFTPPYANRSSAPFAIADTALKALEYIKANDANVVFSKLKIYWSTSNRPVQGSVTSGQIGSTKYDRDHLATSQKAMYLLGDANNDTDEYDVPVILHETFHYLEQSLFRSDSFGGFHAGNIRLEPRLAFSEGFANAFSGMVRSSTSYYDTKGANNETTALNLNLESKAASNNGLTNENSIAAIIWDIYDTTNDPGDTLNGGFLKIYNTMKGSFKTNSALTTYIAFAAAYKNNYFADSAAFDALAANESIVAVAASDWFSLTGASPTTSVACRNNVYISLALPFSTNASVDNTGGATDYCTTKNYKITGDGLSRSISLSGVVGCDLDLYVYKSGSIVASSYTTGKNIAENINNFIFQNGVIYVLDIRLYSRTGTGGCSYSLAIN